MNKRLQKALLVLVCLGGMTAAQAQDAGSLMREQERQQSTPDSVPLATEEPAQLAPLPQSTARDSVTVVDLTFSGKTELLTQAEREALKSIAIGSTLDLDGFQVLASRATQLLHQRGELLAYANLPPQDVTEGTVTLELRKGRLSNIEIAPSDSVRLRGERLQAIGEKALSNGVDRRSLESALLRMNDLPGISARGSLSPGALPDTSQLTVRVDEGRLVTGIVYANNYGVESTGDIQTAGTLNLNNLSGYGDYSSITYSRSQGQDYVALNGQLPVGATPFTARIGYSRLDYEHRKGVGKELNLEGEATLATLGLDYALIRSRALRLNLNADYLQQRLEDLSVVGKLSDKDIDAWRIGFSGDYRDNLGAGWSLGGITQFSGLLTIGDLDLAGELAALAADQAGLDTHGNFRTININLARHQYLPHNFTLYGRLYGQWASKNLDSSQKISLGGPYGLRGWPVAEAQGDKGVLGTLELRYRVPQFSIDGGYLQLATFIDAGRIALNQDRRGVPYTNACDCNRYSLKSAGLNASWQHRNLNLNATWARSIGSNPGRSAITGNNTDDKDDHQQLWVQASVRF